MTALGFPRKLRGAALTTNNTPRLCPQCEAADAAAHPLAIGAVVTVMRLRNRCLVAAEGTAPSVSPIWLPTPSGVPD